MSPAVSSRCPVQQAASGSVEEQASLSHEGLRSTAGQRSWFLMDSEGRDQAGGCKGLGRPRQHGAHVALPGPFCPYRSASAVSPLCGLGPAMQKPPVFLLHMCLWPVGCAVGPPSPSAPPPQPQPMQAAHTDPMPLPALSPRSRSRGGVQSRLALRTDPLHSCPETTGFPTPEGHVTRIFLVLVK